MVGRRVLNRTLLQRQHLLDRASVPPLAMTEHLVGLQAQDVLAPYLSLWARLEGFRPEDLSRALEERTAVRILLMRGTIHLVTADDALTLRPVVQPMLDKITRNSATSKPAGAVPRDALAAAGRAAFHGGPLPFRQLGPLLQEQFPGPSANSLANTVREMLPLVQVPPRGLWKRSGGVVYDTVDGWLGRALATTADMREVVRRYLRAFGPATAADMSTWSGVTGLREVIAAMSDELRTVSDDDGRRLFDLEDLTLAEADIPVPVRLLGRYDNLWLSHAQRDRVTEPEKRKVWMGVNGGVGSAVFVDGMLEGIWRTTPGGKVDVQLLRRLTANERDGLHAEVGALELFLAD